MYEEIKEKFAERITEIEKRYLQDLIDFALELKGIISYVLDNKRDILFYNALLDRVQKQISKTDGVKELQFNNIFSNLSAQQYKIIKTIYYNPNIKTKDLVKIFNVKKDTLDKTIRNAFEKLQKDELISDFFSRNKLEFKNPITTIKNISKINFDIELFENIKKKDYKHEQHKILEGINRMYEQLEKQK